MLNSKKPKEVLSINKNARLHIENFFEDLPLSIKVLKNEFEESCNHLYISL